MALENLITIREQAFDCYACRLSEARTHVVFGCGATRSPLIAFVGEAPGEHEDLDGEPFVGKAGRVLTHLLTDVGLARTDVYICNTVMCRPPRNRVPLPDEVAACSRFLDVQLTEVRPQVIVALGRVAGNALLACEDSVGTMRNRWWDWRGTPVRVTYHPSYLLRNSAGRPLVLHDLSVVLERARVVR